ncbi:MAG TPA: hypothetical protein VJU84_16000 [Pyrinomonadaceae bacterium]|nr:hypothetical protein [Pyrinomonadaceae bacterium]
MSAALKPYEYELRKMAAELASNAKRELKLIDPASRKPLYRTKAYLVSFKECTVLLTEWLKEFKELIVVVSLICFFVWGVIDVMMKLHSHPF